VGLTREAVQSEPGLRAGFVRKERHDGRISAIGSPPIIDEIILRCLFGLRNTTRNCRGIAADTTVKVSARRLLIGEPPVQSSQYKCWTTICDHPIAPGESIDHAPRGLVMLRRASDLGGPIAHQRQRARLDFSSRNARPRELLNPSSSIAFQAGTCERDARAATTPFRRRRDEVRRRERERIRIAREDGSLDGDRQVPSFFPSSSSHVTSPSRSRTVKCICSKR